MKGGKSSFVGCHLLCRELVNSSACVYIMVWDEDCNIANETEVVGETSSNARTEPTAERGLHRAFNTGPCCIKMVQGNKLAISNANAFPPQCPVPCYPPVSSSISAQSSFSLLPTWLKKYQH